MSGYKSKFSGSAFDQFSTGGADADIQAVAEESDDYVIRYIDIGKIKPNDLQFRRIITGIEEMAESIREHGIIQPILVERVGVDSYKIACGERRWRGATLAGLAKVPCVIRNGDDRDSIDEVNFIENVQRSALMQLEKFSAIREFRNRYYNRKDGVSKILKMCGEKHASYVYKATRVGAFAEKAQAGGFASYMELAELCEGVTLNNLYRISIISDNDVEIAVNALKEINERSLAARATSEFLESIREKLNIVFGEAESEDEASAVRAREVFGGDVISDGKVDIDKAVDALMAPPAFGHEEPPAEAPPAEAPAVPAGEAEMFIDVEFAEASTSQGVAAPAPDALSEGGLTRPQPLSGGSDGIPLSDPLSVGRQEIFRPSGQTDAASKPKIEKKPEYSDLDWVTIKIVRMGKSIDALAAQIAKVDAANIIIEDEKKKKQALEAIDAAYAHHETMFQHIARLRERVEQLDRYAEGDASGAPDAE